MVASESDMNYIYKRNFDAHRFRTDGRFCDFTITSSDDVKFKVHRIILDTFVPYFKESLEESAMEIKIENIASEQLEKIVDFIYSGEIGVNVENADEIEKCAAILGLSGLKEFCADIPRHRPSTPPMEEPEKVGDVEEFKQELNSENVDHGKQEQAYDSDVIILSPKTPQPADIILIESSPEKTPKEIKKWPSRRRRRFNKKRAASPAALLSVAVPTKKTAIAPIVQNSAKKPASAPVSVKKEEKKAPNPIPKSADNYWNGKRRRTRRRQETGNYYNRGQNLTSYDNSYNMYKSQELRYKYLLWNNARYFYNDRYSDNNNYNIDYLSNTFNDDQNYMQWNNGGCKIEHFQPTNPFR